MDRRNQRTSPNERIGNHSTLQRTWSLPNLLVFRPNLWIYDTVSESTTASNSELKTTNYPQSEEHGYEIDELQNNNNSVEEPIGSSSIVSSTQFDVNLYQQKKTLAQGMMDLALISANANQLRYVLQMEDEYFFHIAMSMIVTSIFLQVVVGIGLIWNSTYNVKLETHIRQANKTNNWTVIGIFLVTILNVFISSFGVSTRIDDEMQSVTTR